MRESTQLVTTVVLYEGGRSLHGALQSGALQVTEQLRFERAHPNPSACWPHVEDRELRHEGMSAHLLLQNPSGTEQQGCRGCRGLRAGPDRSSSPALMISPLRSPTMWQRSPIPSRALSRVYPRSCAHRVSGMCRVFPYNCDLGPTRVAQAAPCAGHGVDKPRCLQTWRTSLSSRCQT